MNIYRFNYAVLFLLSWIFAPSVLANEIICEQTGTTHIWISPLIPKANELIKIMAVSTDEPVTELSVIDSQGRHISLQSRRRGGPPWSLVAEFDEIRAGNYRVVASRDDQQIACQPIITEEPILTGRYRAWDLATEAFYSAWIEELFGAPIEEKFSFNSLEPVLRNIDRNFLYNYLDLNEDISLALTPDCADLPYTLRAYFAWKIGLPNAFRACNRGSAAAPSRCSTPTIISEFGHKITSQASFMKFCRQLVNTVHSRTEFTDESTDLYPVSMSRKALWRGTVYADPYGHILVLVEWVSQTTDRPGMLLAVDAQPDNSIARKRVWEGTLLFARTKSAGPGFKAFRPLVRTQSNNWRLLSNEELIAQSDFAPFY
ncbi:hypothetical protein [Nitrosomonas supralitoralis]|uniref:hypothetical protein n=1 Tax=Nitrosomonas supralitoralis TaxID=2116706 RepID=UPI001F5B6A41|nr:hypothetical protein [Nitrosomonas supralitoralis]